MLEAMILDPETLYNASGLENMCDTESKLFKGFDTESTTDLSSEALASSAVPMISSSQFCTAPRPSSFSSMHQPPSLHASGSTRPVSVSSIDSLGLTYLASGGNSQVQSPITGFCKYGNSSGTESGAANQDGRNLSESFFTEYTSKPDLDNEEVPGNSLFMAPQQMLTTQLITSAFDDEPVDRSRQSSSTSSLAAATGGRSAFEWGTPATSPVVEGYDDSRTVAALQQTSNGIVDDGMMTMMMMMRCRTTTRTEDTPTTFDDSLMAHMSHFASGSENDECTGEVEASSGLTYFNTGPVNMAALSSNGSSAGQLSGEQFGYVEDSSGSVLMSTYPSEAELASMIGTSAGLRPTPQFNLDIAATTAASLNGSRDVVTNGITSAGCGVRAAELEFSAPAGAWIGRNNCGGQVEGPVLASVSPLTAPVIPTSGSISRVGHEDSNGAAASTTMSRATASTASINTRMRRATTTLTTKSLPQHHYATPITTSRTSTSSASGGNRGNNSTASNYDYDDDDALLELAQESMVPGEMIVRLDYTEGSGYYRGGAHRQRTGSKSTVTDVPATTSVFATAAAAAAAAAREGRASSSGGGGSDEPVDKPGAHNKGELVKLRCPDFARSGGEMGAIWGFLNLRPRRAWKRSRRYDSGIKDEGGNGTSKGSVSAASAAAAASGSGSASNKRRSGSGLETTGTSDGENGTSKVEKRRSIGSSAASRRKSAAVAAAAAVAAVNTDCKNTTVPWTRSRRTTGE